MTKMEIYGKQVCNSLSKREKNTAQKMYSLVFKLENVVEILVGDFYLALQLKYKN